METSPRHTLHFPHPFFLLLTIPAPNKTMNLTDKESRTTGKMNAVSAIVRQDSCHKSRTADLRDPNIEENQGYFVWDLLIGSGFQIRILMQRSSEIHFSYET